MEAVTKLKKKPYDDFSLKYWNLDSDLAKTNLPRLVAIMVGDAPLVMRNMFRFTTLTTDRRKQWKRNGQI